MIGYIKDSFSEQTATLVRNMSNSDYSLQYKYEIHILKWEPTEMSNIKSHITNKFLLQYLMNAVIIMFFVTMVLIQLYRLNFQ